MTSPDLLAGVDAGATTVRAGVGRGAGQVFARAHADATRLTDGAPALAALVVGLVREALTALRAAAPVRALVVGAAGAGRAPAAAALDEALAKTAIAQRHLVVTDVELVLADAFGDGSGVALIAGTGSIAMGRLPSGEVIRAGGHGAETGDPGSGYAIGAGAARLAAAEHDASLLRLTSNELGLRDETAIASWLERATPAGVAALAAAVVRAAAAGDPAAARIVDAAVRDLASLVAELIPRFRGCAVPVALAGGLFADSWFRRRVEDAVARASPEAHTVAGERDAVRGALWLAARLTTYE